MKPIRPDLPAEVLNYKDRYVWPLKSRYDAFMKKGQVDQITVREQLLVSHITPLSCLEFTLQKYSGQPWELVYHNVLYVLQ
jgi:hypothetical protein